MEYELKIVKRKPNPDYPPKQPNYYPETPAYLSEECLMVIVTENQFEAIRKAALEVF